MLSRHLSTISLARCRPVWGTLLQTTPFHEACLFFSKILLTICKIEPLSFSHYLSAVLRSSSFLHPVYSASPRPSHLPAAMMRSNWLMGLFSWCPTPPERGELLQRQIPEEGSVFILWKLLKSHANPSSERLLVLLLLSPLHHLLPVASRLLLWQLLAQLRHQDKESYAVVLCVVYISLQRVWLCPWSLSVKGPCGDGGAVCN